jgi:hypothetical protein
VRIGGGASARVLHRRCSATLPARCTRGLRHPTHGVFVLDVVYLLGIIAVFALVGLIARGVEKL